MSAMLKRPASPLGRRSWVYSALSTLVKIAKVLSRSMWLWMIFRCFYSVQYPIITFVTSYNFDSGRTPKSSKIYPEGIYDRGSRGARIRLLIRDFW
jgi:hypothetical protein